MDLNVPLHVIGIVRTGHLELETTPIQSSVNRAEHGAIELAEPYADGLDGLAEFDYAWLLTWLDRPDQPSAAPAMRQVPFARRASPAAAGPTRSASPKGQLPACSANPSRRPLVDAPL
jgi:tRNA (adenine37-N6)-methyltransferase